MERDFDDGASDGISITRSDHLPLSAEDDHTKIYSEGPYHKSFTSHCS